MSTTDIYRPSNGDLHVRHSLATDYPAPTDSFRKSRPSTTTNAGGYRFGHLSQNSFFTRHNPHPARVRHMKGLLDIPICSVNDTGYMSNPRYSLQFPPSNFNEDKLNNRQPRIPVNALNVNSQLHPINTVTGLQYFTGLNSFPFREKAIPKVGLVPVEEAWRDELKKLTDAMAPQDKRKEAPKPTERPRTQYSADTGRIIPPPSRAMSRQSRHGSRAMNRTPSRGGYGRFQHIMAEPDMECMVLTMLAQILQTEDINAVKSWLVSAAETDKNMALELIGAAMAGREEYADMHPRDSYMDRGSDFKLPPINDNQENGDPNAPKHTDRLVIEDSRNPDVDNRFIRAMTPTQAAPMQTDTVPYVSKPMVVDGGQYIATPMNDVFKQRGNAFRNPDSGNQQMLEAGNPMPRPPSEIEMRASQQYPIENNETTMMRYTKSPKESENSLKEWRPAAVASPNTF